MPFRWRVVIGFALAPLVSLATFTLWIVLSSLLRLGPIQRQSVSSLLDGIAELKTAVLAVSALSAALVGVPLFLWKIRRRQIDVRSALVAGLVVGGAPLLGLLVIGFGAALARGISSGDFWSLRQLAEGLPLALWWLLLLGVCGVASAWVFWIVALRGHDPISREDAAA
jgi:hypothetical protein